MVADVVESGELITKPKYIIIRDVMSNDQHSVEVLEEQLESAFESQVQHIIIEPTLVGDETSKWIRVGNFLHKSSVLTGILCFFTPLIYPRRYKHYVIIPLCTINLICTTLYNFSWQHDPCCKYQVERDTEQLEQLQFQTLTSSSPVILVHRDDKYRKRLHNVFSICIVSYLGWVTFKYYKG